MACVKDGCCVWECFDLTNTSWESFHCILYCHMPAWWCVYVEIWAQVVWHTNNVGCRWFGTKAREGYLVWVQHVELGLLL